MQQLGQNDLTVCAKVLVHPNEQTVDSNSPEGYSQSQPRTASLLTRAHTVGVAHTHTQGTHTHKAQAQALFIRRLRQVGKNGKKNNKKTDISAGKLLKLMIYDEVPYVPTARRLAT